MQNSPDSFPVRKVCCTCKEEKDHAQFFKDAKLADGLYRCCKPCHLERTKRWKQANKDKVNVAATSRYAEKKETLRPLQQVWEKANAEKRRRQKNQRYAADPATYIAKARARQAKNPERTKEISRSSYWRNHDKALAAQRRYKAENPEAMKLLEIKRRASEKQFFIGEAYRLAKLREKICGGKWHVDHIVPIQSKLVCGLHVESNLRVIPAFMNISKSNRHWPDMP